MKRAHVVGLAIGASALLAATSWRRRSRYIDLSGLAVIVTGGSRGLGLVMARQLADMGARLTLIARDKDELERARIDLETHGASPLILACDVRKREEIERAIETSAAHMHGIDVLINNAGVIQVGPVAEMSVEDFENAMNSHFWGPLHAIRAALPHLRRSPAARIVNISSIGGKVCLPHLVPYSASKFALTGLSQGLHAELANENITVTTACPGLMRTGSTYNALFKGNNRAEFAWFHIADSLPWLSTDARIAARRIITACQHGDAEVVVNIPARVAVLFNAVFPSTTATLMRLTNRLLPSTSARTASPARSGWQSVSAVAPSVLTRLADRATSENNELPSTAGL